MTAKQIMATLIILAHAAGAGGAVKLSETPIQKAMQARITNSLLAPVAIRSQAWDNDEFGGSGPQSRAGPKSIFKVVLYSTLIPGGGQYYLGKRKTARYFFAAEAMTWLGYLSFRTYGNWLRNDYINYAAVHANADLEGKSDEYLNWVGFYNNIREFNGFGRAWDPERSYLPDTPENHWEWTSDDERRTFRDLRNGSKESYRRSDFMIGVALLDRVVSVIDAVRSARRLNRQIEIGAVETDQNRWVKLSVNPLSSRRQVCLTFYPGL